MYWYGQAMYWQGQAMYWQGEAFKWKVTAYRYHAILQNSRFTSGGGFGGRTGSPPILGCGCGPSIPKLPNPIEAGKEGLKELGEKTVDFVDRGWDRSWENHEKAGGWIWDRGDWIWNHGGEEALKEGLKNAAGGAVGGCITGAIAGAGIGCLPGAGAGALAGFGYGVTYGYMDWVFEEYWN